MGLGYDPTKSHEMFIQHLHDAKVDGFEGLSLADWVCFATHGSRMNSEHVVAFEDGHRNYGIFELSNRLHCQDTPIESENLCKTCCTYFLNEDLSDDIECLKRYILSSNGLKSWIAWRDNCSGQNIHQYIKDCGPDIEDI
nr:lysozyme C-1-like [Anolis sagrei ordinatus]